MLRLNQDEIMNGMKATMNTTFAPFLMITLLATSGGCIGQDGEPEDLVEDTNGIDEPRDTTAPLESICEPRSHTGSIAIDSVGELETLRGVTSITGRLTLRFTDLENVDGLECLESVGDLYIEDNDQLVDLSGLANLRRVNGQIVLQDNDELSSLNGFESLEFVAGSIEIDRNSSLTTIDGFAGLQRIGGDLTITRNESLRSLTGFGSLEWIDFDLYLIDNPVLIDFGLTALQYVGSGIYISGNGSFSCCGVEDVAQGMTDVAVESIEVFIEDNSTDCE